MPAPLRPCLVRDLANQRLGQQRSPVVLAGRINPKVRDYIFLVRGLQQWCPKNIVDSDILGRLHSVSLCSNDVFAQSLVAN